MTTGARQERIEDATRQPQQPTDHRRSATTAIFVVLLTLLGLGLRMYDLDRLPYWNDECLQLDGAKLPFSQTIRNHLHRIEFMPPTSYWIQHVFWLFSPTEYAARLPSALFGAAMIPIAFLLGRRMAGNIAGIALAGMTTTSFFFIYYSQECRTYIFFGFACALLLLSWIDIFLQPTVEHVPVRKWILLTASGMLCGAFHFASLILLPSLGLISAVRLALEWKQGASTRHAIRRLFGFILTLIAAAAVSYAIMKISLNPEWDATSRVGGAKPSLLSFRSWFNYTWGAGWRLIPLTLLSLMAWFPSNRSIPCITPGGTHLTVPIPNHFGNVQSQQLTNIRWTASAFLFAILFPLAICYVFFPGFLSPSRYLFWNHLCLLALASLGLSNILAWTGLRSHQCVSSSPSSQASPWRPTQTLVVTLFLAIYIAVQVPVFYHYYVRMECKQDNTLLLKRTLESMPGQRLFVLDNGYLMHWLRYFWPTNCTMAAAPVWNNSQEHQTLRIDQWVLQVVRQYPNVVLFYSTAQMPRSVPLVELTNLFNHRTPILHGEGELYLSRVGLNPHDLTFEGEPKSIWFNRDSELLSPVNRPEPGILFPGNMPLLTTRNADGSYAIWRVLTEPSTILVFSDKGGSSTIPVDIARCGHESSILAVKDGTSLGTCDILPDQTDVYDARKRSWIRQPLRIQDIAQLAYRLPTRISVCRNSISAPLNPGWNQVTLIPRRTAVLLMPATPH